MTQSHTPGPWHIEQFTSGYSKHEDRTISHRLESGNMLRIARAYNVMGPNETDANARLIAAAPDLLAACHALMRAEAMQEGKRGGEIMGQISLAIDAARAAIAKATGA